MVVSGKKRLAFRINLKKTGYILLLCLFTGVFFLCCFTVRTNAERAIERVTITYETNGVRVTCGGFVCGECVFTVAHVFAYEDLNALSYEHRNGLTYFPLQKGIHVQMDRRRFVTFGAFVDTENDVAILVSPVVGKETVFRETPSFFFPVRVQVGPDPKYVTRRVLRVVQLGKGSLLQISGTVEKGVSGYPVLDSSGYVTGILRSVDRMHGVTYATGGDVLKRTYERFAQMSKSTTEHEYECDDETKKQGA